MTAAYRCANCGSERVAVDLSRPSLDERYAIGFCERENAEADAAKKARKPAQLVRSDLYEHIRAQRALKEERERRARVAKASVSPGKARISEERMREGARVVEELHR